MTPPDISTILPLRGTMVTLDGHSAAGTVLADQLVRLTNGAPIVIQGAVRRVLGSTVTVTGTASLLHVSNMNVTAIATPESAGISLVIYFNLIEGTPTATSWLFSKSFPDLPPFLSRLGSPKTALDTASTPGPNLLDRLSLSDAQLVLASAAHPIDAITGVPLVAGLNFVAKCSPTGLLGLLGSLASGGHPVLLYGPIVLPLPTQATLPMPQTTLLKFPWQLADPIPGIQLTADLGIDQTLGKALRIHNVGMRLYCPPTQAWAAANPSFNPILAATAKLEVPSAKLSLDLTVLGLTGRSLMLCGQFEGVTVGGLTQLADLAGGTDLLGYLPADLAKAVTALGKLSLLGMTLYLDSSLSLTVATVTLGLPGINTQVLPGLTLRQLNASFSVVSPFGPDRAVSVELGGSATFLGAPFDVVLALPEVVASGRLTGSTTLPLATLTQAVGLPAAPALTINELQFEMSKDGSYAVAAVLAERPPWTIDLGPVPLTLANLSLVAQHPKAGATSGTFSGVIALGIDLTLGFSYQSPGDFVLRGQLPDVGLLQLGSALTRQSVALPGGFDFALTDGSVLIQKSGNDLVFLYATTMAGLGTVEFEARRVGAGAWGFAAGIDLQGLRISGLPGLSALKPFEDVFHLDEILVVVASFADPAFQLPGLAAFDTPTIRSDNLQLPAGGVIAGLNIHARWTIDTSSRQQALLGRLLGLNPTLGVTLQVGKDPAADSRLYVSYDTTLQGHPFSCRFGLQMTAGQVSLFLLGTLQASIQGQPCRFDVVLLFVPNGAFLSGSMLGSVQFSGVTLSNLAVVVGIDWEGLPSLGIAAEIAVDRFESSLAIFFDSTDPSRSMVAGSVSDLSLKDVVDTLAGAVLPSGIDAVLPKVELVGTGTFTVAASLAKALDNRQLDVISAAFAPHAKVPSLSSQVLFVVSKPGQAWFLTDMTTLLHYEIVKTGTGIQVSLEPQIYIVPNTTSIGALRFEQGFFLNTGLHLLSFQAMAKVMVRPSQGILVDGSMDRIVIGTPALFSLTSADGKSGPRVSAATMSQPEATDPALRDPHFLLDTQLSMLGLTHRTYVSLGAGGFEFAIADTLVPGATYDLHGHFSGLTDLGAGGVLRIAVPAVNLGPLGSIDVGTGAQGSLDLGVKGASLWAKFSASFELAGTSISLPTVDLDVNGPSLLDLPRKIVDLVGKAVKDALADPLRWATLAFQGFVKGVVDVAMVLRDVFGQRTADAAAAILSRAGYAAGAVAAGLKSAYSATVDQAAALLRGAGYAVDQAASALNSAYGATADQVGSALKSAYGVTVDQAVALLRGAGYTVDQVGSALRSAYGATADQAVALLRGAGYTVDQVGSALRSAYGATADQAAALLKGAGYAADQVGSALRSAYGATADQAAALLKGAGYTADQVGSALRSVYGATVDEAAKILKGAGYGVNEIGDALKNGWGATANDVGRALAGAGYAVDQTGTYLKDAYGLGPDALNSALLVAGYTGDAIKGFFSSLGGSFSSFFNDISHDLDPTNW